MQYLSGVTFPQQTHTPKEWGHIFSKLVPDGILNGCGVSASGANVYVDAGALMIAGRLIEIPSTITEATSPTYPNGYGQVKVCIDTTNASTTLLNQQAYLEVVYSSSSAFPALTQNDINGSGTLYEVELAVLTYVGGSVSDVSVSLGNCLGSDKILGSDNTGKMQTANVDTSYLSGISSNVQTQLDGKQPLITSGTSDPTGGNDGDIYIKYTV